MKAALRTIAMLSLAPVLVLLGGLPPLLQTGQIDLRSWTWPALILVPIALMLGLRRGWPHAVWAGIGSFGSILIFIALAGASLPEMKDVGWLGLVILLAVTAGICLSRQLWAGLLFCAAALLSCWLAGDPPVAPSPEPRPTLAVISALPLFWREGEAELNARADAPIVTTLRERFDLRPVDSPLSPAVRKASALLLAQPRAFAPAEVVALDGWVRDGGHLLLLADPLLRWPSSLPLGDRRRPPIVSMAGALLDHWGVELLPPDIVGEQRHMLGDGRLITTLGSSRFARRPNAPCRVEQHGLVARCQLGKGDAVLVADADLIDDRLWLADAARPLDAGQWTADTPGFVIEALGGGTVAARNWLRSMDALVLALRWALIGGIFWAMLGWASLARFSRARRAVSPRQTCLEKVEN